MDKISIFNLKLPGYHGVYDFEKKKVGIFEIDVEMFLDLSKPGKTDNLIDSVDYANVTEIIIKIFNTKRYSLIESIAESICKSLIDQFPIEKVSLKIRKPHAPIKANFDNVEVQLIRVKDG